MQATICQLTELIRFSVFFHSAFQKQNSHRQRRQRKDSLRPAQPCPSQHIICTLHVHLFAKAWPSLDRPGQTKPGQPSVAMPGRASLAMPGTICSLAALPSSGAWPAWPSHTTLAKARPGQAGLAWEILYKPGQTGAVSPQQARAHPIWPGQARHGLF